MQSTITPIKDWKTTLTVELDRAELAQYVERTEHEAVASLEIDGFRKGKAPLDVARKHIDKEQLLQAALEQALHRSLASAIAEKDLDVLHVAELSIKENSAEKLLYTVILTVAPEIKVPDLAQIKVARKAVEVTDKEIDETLTMIRESRAAFNPKEGVAATGDRVEIDFTVKDGGTLIEGGESKNHPVVIGDKKFIPGFEDELVGMKKDDQKSFSLTAPKDYFHKDIAGKKLDFSVTMRAVQTVEKPELTDAFAQTIGQFQNVDQLKGSIREGIYAEKREKETQRVRLEILGNLIEKANVPAPDFMVTDQLNAMVAGFDQDLHGRGMELGLYLAQMNKTQDDLRKEWRPEAEKQVKISLLVHEIAKQKNLIASDEEVEEAFTQMVQMMVARGTADPASINPEQLKQNIRERMTSEKALNFIEGVCAKEDAIEKA
jgi:trigger factor